MTLDEFLKAHHMSQAEFARQVDSTEATISRVRRGLVMPLLDLAVRIVEFTHSEVSIRDLLDGHKQRGVKL